jgi:hypothetical protein
MQDPALQGLVERDYRELHLILMPGQAWKSAVVLAGSILEAVLFDLLQPNETRAKDLPFVRKDQKTHKPEPLKNWTLGCLIQAANALGLLPDKKQVTRMHDLMQNFRNLVHPAAEAVKKEAACTEAEALQCKGFLDEICNDLEEQHRSRTR